MFPPTAVIAAFIAFVISVGIVCPCPNKIRSVDADFLCFRDENEAAISHVAFFAFIGYCFPTRFFFWQLLGILWEVSEFMVDANPHLLKYIGGCAHQDIKQENIGNIIDNALGKLPTQDHVWHPSFSDVFCNIIGFMIGYGARVTTDKYG